MKKVVFIAILIIILIYGYGCRKKEFRFYHDIDEIMKVDNSIGKALYFHETGLKNYKGYHQFDEEEFSELIEKYMNND